MFVEYPNVSSISFGKYIINDCFIFYVTSPLNPFNVTFILSTFDTQNLVYIFSPFSSGKLEKKYCIGIGLCMLYVQGKKIKTRYG